MVYKTFTEYLFIKHAEQYHGIDDDMPDDFNKWLEDIEQWQLIDWADEAFERLLQGKNTL